MTTHYIVADLVKIYKEPKKSVKNFLTVLAWGDGVDLIRENEKSLEIGLKKFEHKADGSILPVYTTGYIMKASKSATPKLIATIDKKDVMMVTFVDVQQGDACVVKRQKGKPSLLTGAKTRCLPAFLPHVMRGRACNNQKK